MTVPVEITLHAGRLEEDGRKIASFIWPEELGNLRIPTKWLLSPVAAPEAPSDAVERVARALCKETFRRPAEKCPLWPLHLDDARAALAALRPDGQR